MRAFGKDRSLCEEARAYYYELLCHDDAAVPEVVVRHVRGCSNCQGQIERLKDAFVQAEKSLAGSSNPGAGAAIESLNRQFEFLGEPVRCSHVRPFLPELAASGGQIRIPTPITVHIDNCPQCAEDLASIRSLGLRIEQLERLGRFYDESSRYSPSICGQAQGAIASLAGFALDETDPEALDHVSRCPRCRDGVLRQRTEKMARLRAEPVRAGVLNCKEIRPADFFDFTMPFGLDAPSIARADGRRDAVITHVRACPCCLEKVQSLHRCLFTIAERADSAVSTIYGCRDEAEDLCEPRCRYPVDVQVLYDEPAPTTGSAAPPANSGRPKRIALSSFRTRLPVKTILSAAVVLFAAWIAVNTRTATGTDVDELVEAIENTPNVCLVGRDGSDPDRITFELLMSRDLKTVVHKIPGLSIVCDLDKRQKTVIEATGSSRTSKLGQEEFDRYAGFMSRTIRDVFEIADRQDRFPTVAEPAPDGDKLSAKRRIRDGGIASDRVKISMDPAQSQLPRQIEYRSTESVKIMTFDYPSTADMKARITALLRRPQ